MSEVDISSSAILIKDISINAKFCDKDGAEVPDDTTFDVYKQMNGDTEGVNIDLQSHLLG